MKASVHKEISNVIHGSGPLCLTRCLSRLSLPLPFESTPTSYKKQRCIDLTCTFGICSVHTVTVSKAGKVSKPNFVYRRSRQTKADITLTSLLKFMPGFICFYAINVTKETNVVTLGRGIIGLSIKLKNIFLALDRPLLLSSGN